MSVPQLNSDSRNLLDKPPTDPTDDLLDMNQHALALANYIRGQENQLPFTVGVFGEWGEGKTTMVHFLHHHLTKLREAESGPSMKFVEFSAWPFTTSEKLWRALILEIARVLFNEPKKTEINDKSRTQEKSQYESRNWKDKLSHFLVSPFFPIGKPQKPLSDYEQFVKDLDETDYGRISKRTPTDEVDQEAMATAVFNGALTLVGTMAPIISGLRGLIGLRTDTEQLGRAKTGESSTKAIDALPSFQKIFGDVLKEKADGAAVYVFIDDLDRAQPDVALDIMESIRIALSEVGCVFILAVDETLIAQGLRLRYKELFAEEKKAGVNNPLANKSQEYLEKIIQFRTRLPPRTAEQTKRLIAAEFPDWTPAGDIIQTIANNNPRRIKQYCHRLSFQKEVGSMFILGSAWQETAETAPPGTSTQGTPAPGIQAPPTNN